MAPYNGSVVRGLSPALVALLAAGLAASDAGSDYARASRKFTLLEDGRVPPGAHVDFSPGELNAYVREKAGVTVPEGLRDPRLEFGHGSATGSAWIDFMKLPEARKLPMNLLLRLLIGGERPVRVKARIRSSGGKAVVDVESVRISGLTVEGAPLDFLIRNFLLPRYPHARIGALFELERGIERLEVEPGGVRVVLKN